MNDEIRSPAGRRLCLLTLLVVCALGLAATPAGASTATLVDLPPAPCKPVGAEPCLPPAETALVYSGGGEANRVVLSELSGSRIAITDNGAVIQPGRGCVRLELHRVTCRQPSASRLAVPVVVAPGAGADRVRCVLALGAGIDGGPGNDVLAGCRGADLLFGGSGADRLGGGGGDDALYEASRRDFLANAVQPAPPLPVRTLSAGRSRDSYDGGSGQDSVSYEGRFARLTINLASAKPRAGARGERDTITRVEHAIGGSGADRIAGNRRANLLDGARGRDLLAGGGGADRLQGGPGNDVIRGGSGNDAVNLPGPASADRIDCGSGRDTIGTVFPRDLVADDCNKLGFYPPEPPEKLQVLGVDSLLPLRWGRPPRVLRGGLGCAPDAVCLARAELRVRGPGRRGGTAPRRGTLLGSQTVSVTGTESKAFELTLSSTGLQLLRRHRALRVRVLLASQFSRAEAPGYTTVLRAPWRHARQVR